MKKVDYWVTKMRNFNDLRIRQYTYRLTGQFFVTSLATIKSVRILSFGYYSPPAQEMLSPFSDLVLVSKPLIVAFFELSIAYATSGMLDHDASKKRACKT